MIPKIIHFCWLSNDPFPTNIQKCIDSWSKYMPDYQIIHWNFNRFPKGKSIWVDQAYECKKYAFAADYIRLYALYNYGGFYLDTDVEVINSFDDFLALNTMICNQNSMPGMEVAAFGVEKGSQWIKYCLDSYVGRNFIEDGLFNMKPLPLVIDELLDKGNFQKKLVNTIQEAACVKDNVIPVLPCEFFSPKSYYTGIITITKNTRCIHHFAGSWQHKSKLRRWVEGNISTRLLSKLRLIKFRICNLIK